MTFAEMDAWNKRAEEICERALFAKSYETFTYLDRHFHDGDSYCFIPRPEIEYFSVRLDEVKGCEVRVSIRGSGGLGSSVFRLKQGDAVAFLEWWHKKKEEYGD